MRLAIDIQRMPTAVPRPLPASLTHSVTVFYIVTVLSAGLAGFAYMRGVKLDAAYAVADADLTQRKSELAKIKKEADTLDEQKKMSGDLAEWLSITPPAQALLLLFSDNVQANVSFQQLSIDLPPGDPTVKIGLTMLIGIDDALSRADAASQQTARLTDALANAGFRQVNVEQDHATPEGWQYVAIYSLPPKGNYTKLTSPAH